MPLKRLQACVDGIRLKLKARSRTGRRGERAAEKHLKKQGYRILSRNLKNRFGEIDLIALAPDGRMLVVAEVKAAEDPSAMPELRVDREKQKRLTALAAQAVRRYKLQKYPVRFDVLAVTLPAGAEPVIRHYPAAFDSHV